MSRAQPAARAWVAMIAAYGLVLQVVLAGLALGAQAAAAANGAAVGSVFCWSASGVADAPGAPPGQAPHGDLAACAAGCALLGSAAVPPCGVSSALPPPDVSATLGPIRAEDASPPGPFRPFKLARAPPA